MCNAKLFAQANIMFYENKIVKVHDLVKMKNKLLIFKVKNFSKLVVR